MNCNILTYIIYLLVTVLVIVRVGHLLHRHGRIFIINCLHGDVALADAVNRILLSGYYLVNVGYTVLALKIRVTITSVLEMTETLGKKIGWIVLILGIMHIFNVSILLISDRKRTNRELNALKKINKRQT
jgi:hypothetical protein